MQTCFSTSPEFKGKVCIMTDFNLIWEYFRNVIFISRIYLEICWKRSLTQFNVDDRAVNDEKYEGSHFTSFLPNHCVQCVFRGRSTILRNYGYTTYRYSYPCLLFEFSFCNLPATVTIETSFLVLQIEFTGNFSLRSFNHCK